MSKHPQDSHDPDSRPTDIEASKWAIKQSIGFTAEEQDQFFEWLAADPEHASAFSSRRQVWDELNSLAEWRPEHSLKPNPDLLQVPTPTGYVSPLRKLFFVVGGLAAVLALTFFPGIIRDRENPVPRKLAKGEFAHSYEHHRLEDGSVVELNRGAQATVEYTDKKREVSLDAGEAHFTIAKDADRPFIVYARGIAVEAVGTIFNVQINNDSVDVLVTEGRVLVDQKVNKDPGEAHDSPETPIQELTAGQHSVFDLREKVLLPAIKTVSPDEMESKLSWLKQVLSFQSTPLSEIVLEFNRRNFTQITIQDPDIRDLKLTVALKPNNIEGFIELLNVTMDIQAEPLGESQIILRRNPK